MFQPIFVERHAATFNYPSRPYGQHKKSNSEDEDEVADANLNLEPAIITSNVKTIHIHRFRNLYVIMIQVFLHHPIHRQ